MKGLINFKVIFSLLMVLASHAVWSQTDFRLTVMPAGDPITLPTGGASETLIYTVENLGPMDEGDQTQVIFTLDPNIDPASAFSSDTNWQCTPITGQIQCDYFNPYTVGMTTTIELNISPPQFDTLVTNAVQANLSTIVTDTNPANNTINSDINFVSAGSVDLSIDKSMTTGFSTTVAPGDPISFDIAVTNLSGQDATNVVVMDDLISNNIQFDANASSPDCQDLASFIQCDATLLTTGNTVVFTVAGTVSTSTQPGNYTNTATVSANEPDPDNSNNSSDQAFNVVIGGAPEVVLTKTIFGGATQIVQGDTFEYDIQINNTGSVNALNVNFVDNLPPEVTYINHTPLGNFNCTYSAPTINCDATNLPNTTAQDGVRILVSADGAINSNVSNTATSSFADGNSANNTDSVAFTIIAPSVDLDLTMTADAANYTVGDLITLGLQVHNPFGSGGAPPNVEVITTLANEMVFNSAQVINAIGWVCTHDGSPNGGDVTCNSQGNQVPEGSVTDIEIIAVADGVGTTITPFATMTSDFDPNPSNDIANTSFEIFPGNADLSLQFTSLSGVYNQGDSFFYDIQVNNPMGSSASPSDVTVDITLPTEVAFSNTDLSNAPGWFCNHDGSPSGGVVMCDRQGTAFVSFSTHDIRVNVIATSPATGAIAQGVIESVADTVLTNNSDSQADIINAVTSDFGINKTVNVTDATIGDTFTYVLTVNNAPSSVANPSDVSVNDTLPPEVSFDSFVVGTNMGTTLNCVHDGSATGGDFSCDTNGTAFPVGEVVTIDINVTAVATNPSVINTATVQTSTDPDGTGNNNSATSPGVNISVPLITTLSASKEAQVGGVAVTEVNYGQAFDYVLTVSNTGANDAIGTQISDNLPPELVLTGFDITGWNCMPLNTNAVNQVVDCTLTAPLVAASSASILLNVMATNNTSVTTITNQMSAAGTNTGALVMDTNTVNLLSPTANINITQTPSPVDPGDDITFDITFTNSGNSPLTGVQINGNLPQDFTYIGFGGDPGLSCAENAGVVNCTFANPLPVGGAINLSLDLTTIVNPSNPPYTLQVTADAIELTNPISAGFNTIFLASDYSLSMQSNPVQVTPGQTFSHIATIYNSGNFTLTSVNSVLVFPSHAQLHGVQSADMNCTTSGGSVSCSNNQVMMPGDNYSISYDFTTNGQSNSVDTSISVNADGRSKSTSVSTYVSGFDNSFDLNLSKTSSAVQVEQRGEYKYFFDIQNVGTSNQSDFTLSDQLPNDVVFQGYSGNGWSCSGTTNIECQYNDILTSGNVSQLVFDVLAPNSLGAVTNTATLTAIFDENLSNNQSTADVTVVESTGTTAVADLAIEIMTDTVEVLSTEEVIWSIEVSNEGPDAATNVLIENDFPMGFNATEVLVDNGASCVLLSSSFICEMTTLAVNEIVQIQLKGGFSNGFSGLVMNMIEVSADSIDPNTSNNQSSSQLNVVIAEELDADLTLELNADTQEIRQGQTFEMSLVTNNLGPNRAVGAMLTANISGLISQVQVVNSGQWLCQTTSHTMSCQFPGSYDVGLNQTIDVIVTTEQIVQTSEPINVNAMIESSAMDPNPGNNMDSLSNAVTRTPTEDEIFAEFENAVGSGASETVLNTIRNVSSYCARSYFMAIEGLCEDMISAAKPENREDIINAMEEMTPNEVIGQSTSAAEMMTSQFRNVTSRLAQLRGGGGAGVSVAGLTARYGNESIPLGMLAYLNQSEDEEGNVSNISDFVSPWGFFVNGNISMGERDSTGRELGFDFDTYGLTAGVDYRFSPTKVAGVALGYANFDSEIEDEAEMKSTGFTLTGYGSFYIKDNFYVDARISYANPDFEQKRRINFELDDINIDRVATGKTNANQYTVAMSMGYHFNKNSWNITPNASFRYARTTIDAFRETGAGDFNFRFGEQEVKSMVWSFGTSVSKAISLKNGVLSPQFDINISRETENDGGSVEAWFINAPDDELFLIQTDEPDRTYGSAGIGLVFIGANGKQAYINYKSIFGLDGFTRGTINLGARFEF